MRNVTLMCVGKLKESFYRQACEEYIKRLSPFCKVTVVEIPEERLHQNPSQAQIDQALEKEAQAIQAKLPPNAKLVCLCIEGKLYSSVELSHLISTWENTSAQTLIFLIGGSNGLHPSIKEQAWVRLSMSPMTFPHHLARVVVLEQIYRGFQLKAGTPYHK